jgi:repressor LexA
VLAELTPRQRQVFEVVLRTIQEQGYAPSLSEIATKLKISSKNGVNDHLKALEKKGYLRRAGRRAIEILGVQGKPVLTALREIPVLGRVKAGLPLLAEENLQDYIAVPTDLARGKEVFALKVKGDSMIEKGIFEGDHVVLRRQSTADFGDIVCALINDEATLKIFSRRGSTVTLKPANSKYDPIIVKDGDFRILGKVTGLIRKY